MTLLELQTLCSYWLDDLAFGYFTQAQLLVWLNNAQREAQKQLLQAGENFYVTVSQTSAVLNQNDYILPSDFLRNHRLEIVVSGTAPNEELIQLQQLTINQQNAIPNGTGLPYAYYIKKNRFTILPAPDQTYIMRLYYSPRVIDMAISSDTPDVPPQYHEYIAVLATIEGFIKDGRDMNPMLEKKRFYLDLMKQDSENRNVDYPRQVVVTDDDGWGFGW